MKSAPFIAALFLTAYTALGDTPKEAIKRSSLIEINGNLRSTPTVTGRSGQTSTVTCPFAAGSNNYEFSVTSKPAWDNDRLQYDLTAAITEDGVQIAAVSSQGSTYPSAPLKYSFSRGTDKFGVTVLFSAVPEEHP